MAGQETEFAKRNAKILGLSVDQVDSHGKWAKDIEETQGPALNYPMNVGRNFDEVLLALDALLLSAKHQVSTPANWKPGDDVVVPSAMPEDVTKQKFPGGLKVLK